MKRKYPDFTADELLIRIDDYFIHIKGKYHIKKAQTDEAGVKTTSTKVWDREPEPATISGMALFLGFSSRQIFDDYKSKGKFSHILKRGCLRIEVIYEEKLHGHYTSGAIFVLRSLGWNDNKNPDVPTSRSLNIKIIETGPIPVASEKEVIIEA